MLQSDVAMASTDDAADLRGATQGLLELGHGLATHLPDGSGKGGNQVFSPASLAIAFAMLREGAGPAAGREIDQVIGLPKNRQAAYNRIVSALTDVGEGDLLEINDALFLDSGYPVHQAYLRAIKQWYGAGLHQTSFPDQALGDINRWVDAQTHGRIPHLIDQLDPADVFALVNTIYLDAKWQRPFNKYDTSDAPFTTVVGKQVQVKMMEQEDRFDYADGDGWQAVRLPYAGGRLSMWVLLPRGGGDPKDLLSSDALTRATTQATSTQVALRLPRWDIETKADLGDVLKRLGMSATFAPGEFPGITDDPTFRVAHVIQQANITVGEKGTVAAAATAIVAEATSTRLPSGVAMTVDHPFAYAIVHDETGVPLFEGVVGDPSVG